MFKWLLFLLVSLGSAWAAAAPLHLADDVERIDAWPAVTVLVDPSTRLTIDDVLAARERFTAPPSSRASLGLSKAPVWLRVPVRVAPTSDGRWILDVDYAVLNRLDLFVVVDGKLNATAQLGNEQPVALRPLASRAHAAPLVLPPGNEAELFLRVHTRGALILPITLNKPAAFHAHAMHEQMLQGLLLGLGVCLLVYSLMQWVSLREHLYLKYAVLTTGSVWFSVYQFGIGAQYVWGDHAWLEAHSGGLAALMASGGIFLFVEHALRGPRQGRWFAPVMKGGAAFLAAVAMAYALDWIHVHQVSAVIGTVGLMPALLGMPGAIARARRGDAVGWYFLLAWTGYFVSTAVMVAMIRGQVGVNFWTVHSFQIGATLDMLLFMRVIGLRLQAMHSEAQRATREREALMSLAHTDALTGLRNRRGLDVALATALSASSARQLCAVFMIDLDGFKEVNDRFGHDAGDDLLVAVARRLEATLRTNDVVARLGGDEFVVAVSGLHNDLQAQEVGRKLLDAFAQPFKVGPHMCNVGLTIGYALVPLDGMEPAALLRQADAAMYLGKQSGKQCLRRAEAVQAA